MGALIYLVEAEAAVNHNLAVAKENITTIVDIIAVVNLIHVAIASAAVLSVENGAG
jgi:hypothetical protein